MKLSLLDEHSLRRGFFGDDCLGKNWSSARTQIVVEGDALLIDDLKTAIKLSKPHKFLTSESEDIVVRDPSTKDEIDPTATLALPNGIERGTAGNPYIVDDPQQGVF